jgi:DNA polymerase-1
MARVLYADPNLSKKEKRRQTTKSVNFAKLYGAGLEKIALTAGITVDECKAFTELYDTTFPGIKRFQRQVEQVAQQRLKDDGVAWVKTPIGRRLVGERGKEYALVNFIIQGTAADVLKEALVRLDSAGLSEFLLLPVHDEVIFEVPVEDTIEVKHLINQMMTDTRWAVPLTASCEGPFERWGDKYRS